MYVDVCVCVCVCVCMTNLDSILKSSDITFSSSYIQM